MSPAAQVFATPVIGVICFAVILASWFGGVRYFGGVPGGLVAIAVGTVIAWLSSGAGPRLWRADADRDRQLGGAFRLRGADCPPSSTCSAASSISA